MQETVKRSVSQRIINRLRYQLSLNYKVWLSKVIFYKVSKLSDRLHGVDFYTPLSLSELGFPADTESIHYGATRSTEMLKVLKDIKANTNLGIFDFGCGKGLSLANFKKFGFKKVAGVELNKNLCEIAQTNFHKLNLSGIEILNTDALSLSTELDSFHYFFFYNPFTGNTFKTVLENLIASVKRNPRKIFIIYNYPLEKKFIDESGQFKQIYSYTPFFFGGEFIAYESL